MKKDAPCLWSAALGVVLSFDLQALKLKLFAGLHVLMWLIDS